MHHKSNFKKKNLMIFSSIIIIVIVKRYYIINQYLVVKIMYINSHILLFYVLFCIVIMITSVSTISLPINFYSMYNQFVSLITSVSMIPSLTDDDIIIS